MPLEQPLSLCRIGHQTGRRLWQGHGLGQRDVCRNGKPQGQNFFNGLHVHECGKGNDHPIVS